MQRPFRQLRHETKADEPGTQFQPWMLACGRAGFEQDLSMHIDSDKLFEICPKCGAWPMAALDVEVTRMSGSVAFRCGRCRAGLTRHYRVERPSDPRSRSEESAASRG